MVAAARHIPWALSSFAIQELLVEVEILPYRFSLHISSQFINLHERKHDRSRSASISLSRATAFSPCSPLALTARWDCWSAISPSSQSGKMAPTTYKVQSKSKIASASHVSRHPHILWNRIAYYRRRSIQRCLPHRRSLAAAICHWCSREGIYLHQGGFSSIMLMDKQLDLLQDTGALPQTMKQCYRCQSTLTAGYLGTSYCGTVPLCNSFFSFLITCFRKTNGDIQ